MSPREEYGLVRKADVSPQKGSGTYVHCRLRAIGEAMIEGDEPTRQAEIKLPHSSHAPALARHWLAEWLTAWGRSAEIDRAVLLVSELVTNVRRYTVSDPRLTVAARDAVLRCSVHDASPARPVSREHDVSAETGRGMWLVAALSSAWGVDGDVHGTVIWFELRKCETLQPVRERCVGTKLGVTHRLRGRLVTVVAKGPLAITKRPLTCANGVTEGDLV